MQERAFRRVAKPLLGCAHLATIEFSPDVQDVEVLALPSFASFFSSLQQAKRLSRNVRAQVLSDFGSDASWRIPFITETARSVDRGMLEPGNPDLGSFGRETDERQFRRLPYGNSLSFVGVSTGDNPADAHDLLLRIFRRPLLE